jgi:arabinan endo-1,5-alpha-L-arabinosidase
MKQSAPMFLNADGSVTGALSGTWRYDVSTSTLTIGTQELIIEKGWDWEANPRHTTPVFAGIDNEGSSLWGKKTE